jgi:hypothetical protein
MLGRGRGPSGLRPSWRALEHKKQCGPFVPLPTLLWQNSWCRLLNDQQEKKRIWIVDFFFPSHLFLLSLFFIELLYDFLSFFSFMLFSSLIPLDSNLYIQLHDSMPHKFLRRGSRPRRFPFVMTRTTLFTFLKCPQIFFFLPMTYHSSFFFLEHHYAFRHIPMIRNVPCV